MPLERNLTSYIWNGTFDTTGTLSEKSTVLKGIDLGLFIGFEDTLNSVGKYILQIDPAYLSLPGPRP